ncbi:hypothetical protein ISG33_03430 [Glaciecola sp. MH2013]|uniref:hypothetical protein n=1 Tax=Glaciecola sp. MH2013 TaxID=2785524 RepID=UPI00189F2B64|nr:hypothetical protein [Glaciecola sp. MH2013]MBF7072452.1 hypothetical protein [Glaciecola sp. MH2013]
MLIGFFTPKTMIIVNNLAGQSYVTTTYQKATLQAMGITLYEAVKSVEESQALSNIQHDHPFVLKVLNSIGFSSLAESGLTWLIGDNDDITLSASVLTTPDIPSLQNPELKKRLWLSIKHLKK